MGRHPKQIGATLGVDRRDSGYYSTPDFVAEFLADTLCQLNPAGSTLLDPCVGQGELVRPFLERGICVQGVDILPIPNLPGVDFQQGDFLLDCVLDCANRASRFTTESHSQRPFDFIVANPPYNCHEVDYIRRHKPRLLEAFADIGVHNMYSMFLAAIIDTAREGTLIGVITLDSFLTARAHANLRQKILTECAIHHLLLCPTDMFRDQGADVRTCLLVLQKGKSHQGRIRTLNRPLHTAALRSALRTRSFESARLGDVVLTSPSDRAEFVVGVPRELRQLLTEPRLGERFPCITGISTANDQQHLSPDRRPGYTVPFYKNPGSRKFFTAPDAFLTDDFLHLNAEIPNFMVRNKSHLFQPGITCSSMGVRFSACYLPPDATFGVNANIIPPASDTWWLLSYLNSDVVSFLIRGLLLRSNMITSGYVSRLPIPSFTSATVSRLSRLGQTGYQLAQAGQPIDKVLFDINALIANELNLTSKTLQHLQEFTKHMTRAS